MVNHKSHTTDLAFLPTREELVEFISQSSGKVGKREIARAFGIRGGEKIYLKQLLKELEDEGVLDRKKKNLSNAEELPSVMVVDIRERDRDGEFLAFPVEWDSSKGEQPRFVVTSYRNPKGKRPAPGIGNRVLLHIDKTTKSKDNTYSGKIIKVLKKERSVTLGLFRANASGGGFFVPVQKKDRGKEIPINPGDENGAQDGDLISITLVKAGRFGIPHARVKERLGSIKSERSVSLIAIHAHNIPFDFPQEVLSEAENMGSASMYHRADWRNLPFITIDPPDAKDHDDAVFATLDPNPENPGGFIISVAIADVAYYVRPGSALDREALRRGNSVYFPDRVVPMLPERISNNLCSLRPQEDRPALAVQFVAGADGKIRKSSFHRIMMRSVAKLSYEQAQAAIDGRPDDTTSPILETILKPLWQAYHCVKQMRDKRSPLDLELPERKIILDSDGQVARVVVPPHLEAHKLIEEFMIQANVAAAEFLEKSSIPLIYRIHEEPSFEKMRSLSDVLASIGLKIPKQSVLRPFLFNRILAAVKNTKHELFINEIVLRSQSQAEYSSENIGHFGLNLHHYAHFTSPIRRYSDLVVHRGIIRALKAGEGALPISVSKQDLAEISTLISAAERRAMAAERETIERLIAYFLADHIGATFDGIIAGVTKVGLFVRLLETGADGFVPANSLGRDYYAFHEKSMSLIGEHSNESFQLGDKVTVRLAEVVPAAGAIRFEIIDNLNKMHNSGMRKRSFSKTKTKGGKSQRSTKKGPSSQTKKLKEIFLDDIDK